MPCTCLVSVMFSDSSFFLITPTVVQCMCTCHALMHIWFVGKGRIHVNHEQLGFHRFNSSSPAADGRASSSPVAPPRGPRSGGGPTNPGPAAEARPIRLPARPHWKASEGSAAKPRLTSRVSRDCGHPVPLSAPSPGPIVYTVYQWLG